MLSPPLQGVSFLFYILVPTFKNAAGACLGGGPPNDRCFPPGPCPTWCGLSGYCCQIGQDTREKINGVLTPPIQDTCDGTFGGRNEYQCALPPGN